MKKYIILTVLFIFTMITYVSSAATFNQRYGATPNMASDQLNKNAQNIRNDVMEYNSQLYDNYQSKFKNSQKNKHNYYDQNQNNEQYQYDNQNQPEQKQKKEKYFIDKNPNWWRWETGFEEWKLDY